MTESAAPPSREQLLFTLYEASELEHNLMCTYLYAAFSLRQGAEEGLSPEEAEATARWRRTIVQVATEEMGHLTAVWNITAALGGTPRFGRANFPLDPGMLPAGVVVKLAPFNEAVLQHFIHLERPQTSTEPDGEGFAPELIFSRGSPTRRLTPMAIDYETVGAFYAALDAGLRSFVDRVGEKVAFCGDPLLQLSPAEVALAGAKPVLCSKTALSAINAIVEQGEGAREESVSSHFHLFANIRKELAARKAANPHFEPAFPAAHNPVLRRPLRPQGRVWLENQEAAATVDLANAGYALMMRLLAYSYGVPRPQPEKALAVDLGVGLMRAVTSWAEHAARLPAGPSNPGVHAGVSFTALRDSAPIPPGPSAWRFFRERFQELVDASSLLQVNAAAPRVAAAHRALSYLAQRAQTGVQVAQMAPQTVAVTVAPAPAAPSAAALDNDAPPTPTVVEGVEHIPGKRLTLLFETKRCIHARFCVTGAPNVFLANVQGPWIKPDAMDVENLVAIAHACPSGAIRYERSDGRPNESPAPVNLLAIREAGPYAVRGDLRIAGQPAQLRATLCRCGASKNKPYCDGSHHDVHFDATGEPPSGKTDMLAVRNGPLFVEPELDGPLQVRGNLEITSGTGRVVARVEQARLCRCGGSARKPFCDGTHARIGFTST